MEFVRRFFLLFFITNLIICCVGTSWRCQFVLGDDNTQFCHLEDKFIDGEILDIEDIEFDEFWETQNITKVGLSIEFLQLLPIEFVERFPKLESLSIRIHFDKLAKFFGKEFSTVKTLEIVELAKENAEPFKSDFLHRFPNLEELSVSGKNVELNFGVAGKLKNLEINCEKCQWTEQKFRQLTNLESFKLRVGTSQDAKNLNKLFSSQAHKLKKIEMRGLNVNSIPVSMFEDVANLEKLNLHSNKLESLPDYFFDKNKKLKTINLSSNELKQLSRFTFDGIENLRELYLQFNQIRLLPLFFFSNFESLEKLSLSSNKIEKIVLPMFHKNLKEVDFSFNKIEMLDEKTFEICSNLIEIAFTNNELKSIPENLLKNSPNLISVNFSYNKIKRVPKNLFQNSKKLEFIGFANNRIEDFPENLLDGLGNLKKLSCRYNNIKVLGDIFKSAKSVTYASFEYNPLGKIYPGIVDGLDKSFKWYVDCNDEPYTDECFKNWRSTVRQIENDKLNCGKNGQLNNGNRIPWRAVLTCSNKVYCGAVFVSQKHVLLPAHCIHDVGFPRLYARDCSFVDVANRKFGIFEKRLILHPNYNPYEMFDKKGNIAIAVLKDEISEENFSPVCLSESEMADKIINEDGVVNGCVGTGSSKDLELREIDVTILGYRDDSTKDEIFVQSLESMENNCIGDSGKFLTWRDANRTNLIGLLSKREEKTCDKYGNKIFTNIAKYYDWIMEVIFNTY